MSKFKHLQMWNTICTDARISISKSMFGLRTSVVYRPTNSIVDTETIDFSPADGDQLKRIFLSPRDSIAKLIGDFHPTPIANGNYQAEVCASRDGAFLAVQLLQFQRLNYEPVTEVLIFEGDEARAVKRLF